MKNIRQIIELIAPDASNKEVAQYRTKINTYIKKYKIIYKKKNNKIVLSDEDADEVVKHFKLNDSKLRSENDNFVGADYIRQLRKQIEDQQKTIDRLNNQYLAKVEQQNKQLIETNKALSDKFDTLMQLMNQQQQLHGRDQIVEKQGFIEGHSDNTVKHESCHWWNKLFK